MARNRLRPLVWLATVGALAVGSTTIVACTGKVSNGTVSSTSEPVSVSDVSGTATPCDSGYAHPNVCCEAGPNQAASCVVYPGAPFTQCGGGSTTYPDPRSCCPLDGNGACAAPPPGAIDASPNPGGGSCSYTCPVGWYSPPSSGAGSSGSGTPADYSCCITNPDGSGECMGGGSTLGSSGTSSSSSSGGSSTPGCACACPACDPDSGVCPPCPPCNCPAQPPSTPSCASCPPGWQTPEGDPLLCCSTASDGTISCFSQGVPPPPPDQDAGPAPTSCFGGGGGGPDGSTFTQCGCSETASDGNSYTVTCTDPGGTCVCSVGSSTTGPTVPEPSPNCADMAALFSACGFPVPTGVNQSGTGTSGTGTAGAGSSGSSSGG